MSTCAWSAAMTTVNPAAVSNTQADVRAADRANTRRVENYSQCVVDLLARGDLMLDPLAGLNIDLMQLRIAVRPECECRSQSAVAGDHAQPRIGQRLPADPSRQSNGQSHPGAGSRTRGYVYALVKRHRKLPTEVRHRHVIAPESSER